MRIYHNSRKKEYRDPSGAEHAGTSVTLAIDIAECDARGAELEMWRDGEAREYLPMQQLGWDENGSRYGITMTLPAQTCLIWYRFLIKVMQDGEIRSLYYGNNEAGTGGWETLSPYKRELLDRYGSGNPVKDILDNPDAYLIGDYKKGMLIDYYNRWYGDENTEIVFEKADEIAGNNVYRIVSRTL